MTSEKKSLLSVVYKSVKHEDMYLYINKKEGLERVPEALLTRFGEPKEVMTLLLREERPLARADVHQVIADIDDKGFYLQMPENKESYLLGLLPDYKR